MKDCVLIRGQLRWILVAVLLPVVGMSAWAQRGGGGGGRGGQGGGTDDSNTPVMRVVEVQMPHVNSVDRDVKDLNKAAALTPDQATQIKGIVADRNQRIQALIKEYKEAVKIAAANRKKAGNTSGNQGDGQAAGRGGTPNDVLDRQLANAARSNLLIIRGEALDKIMALLTEAQKKSYADWMAKHGKEQAQEESQDFQYVILNGVGGGGLGI